MQRLIDANAILKHKEVCELDDGQSFEYISTDTINNALTVMAIPDNPTNGDMIKALYPDVHYVLASQGTPRVVTNIGVSFDLEWWNASYKAERTY